MADLSVPYYPQERLEFCGAACLQMVVEYLTQRRLSQRTLYDESHNSKLDPGRNWSSAPDGVEATLEARGNLGPSDVTLPDLESEAALTRRIVWSVRHHGVPAIVLVYGDDHWVVVVECDISRAPESPTDTGYTIRAVEIHDPWRTAAEGGAPPPPPPKHVTLKQWNTKYLKPIPGGRWEKKLMAVGVFTPANR